MVALNKRDVLFEKKQKGLRDEEVLADWGVVVCWISGNGMCHGIRLGRSGDRRFDDDGSRGLSVDVLCVDVPTTTVPPKETMSDVAGGAG